MLGNRAAAACRGMRVPWKTGTLLALLLIGTSILYLHRAGDVPLTDGDSALYGYIAKDLVRTGDWQTMRWRGGPFLDKPPVTMWGMAVGYRLFGFNELGARAWQGALGVLTVLVTFAAARLFYSDRAALWAATFLATSAQFFYQQFVPQQDVPLTFAVALGLYLLALAQVRGQSAYEYLAWAAFGLAVLSKGIAGIVIPGIVLAVLIGLQAWSERQIVWATLRPWVVRSAVGLIPFLAVAGPWYLAEARRHGYPFVDLFFLGGNERFITGWSEMPKGLVYAAYLFLGWIPWSGFLWPAVRRCWEDARRGDQGGRFFFAWFVGVLVLFALLIPQKVMRYVLPLYPAVATMMGRYVDELMEQRASGPGQAYARALRQAAAVSATVVVPLVMVTGLVLARTFSQEAEPYLRLLTPFLVMLALALAVLVAMLWRGRLAAALAGGGALTVWAYVVLLHSLAAHWADVTPWKALGDVVAAQAPQDAPILFDPGMPPYGNVFVDYYVEPRPDLARTDDELAALWRARQAPLILAPAEQLARFVREHEAFALELVKEVPGGWVVARGRPPGNT